MRQTITIHRHGGVRDEIDADVSGHFAIHEPCSADESLGRWAVTHVPTGWVCVFTRTKRAAVAARKAFNDSGIDWSFSDPSAVTAYQRKIGTAIKHKWQGR